MVLSRSQTIGIIGYFPANRFLTQYTVFNWRPVLMTPQPSPHFSYSEINALPLNGQQAVTAISALWLRRSTAFRWLQQPIGRHLMVDVVEQVIERHQEVKSEGISEGLINHNRLATEAGVSKQPCCALEVHNGEVKLLIVLPQAGASANDLLKFRYRVD